MMTTLDPHWLDRMYNNRGLVPEFDQHFNRWQSDSAVARERQPCKLDIRYGDSTAESLDIFPAQEPSGASAPVLVFIHGGYWRSLDKSDQSMVAPAFAQAGACVVIPNYALCPGTAENPVTVSDITLQMVKALAWVYRNIAQHGGDPTRITVVGHSAGGHLAAMMMAALWHTYEADLPARLVKNGMSLSGLFELETIRQTPYLQVSLKLTPQEAQRCSPAWMPSPRIDNGRSVFYSVAGALESAEFLRHNSLIESSWGHKTVPVCEALPGLNHFSILEALAEPGTRLNRLALDLLGL
jgi:arylformamidase